MNENMYDLSVPELFDQACELFPDKEVLYDGYRRMTYKELQKEAANLASSLSGQGIQKGDRVAVCLPNWHEFVVIQLAVASLGAIFLPFNTRYRTDEIEYILNNSGAKVAFFTREFSKIDHFEQFTLAKQRVTSLELMVTVRFDEDGMLSYEQLVKEEYGASKVHATIHPTEDVFTILYTSGTTGEPKGVMLTHHNAVHTAVIAGEGLNLASEDVLLIKVPVFHVFGLIPSILTTFSKGARMVLMDHFKAEKSLSLIQQEKVTIHSGVPTMFILELNHPNFSSYDLTSLRTGLIAGAHCPVEVIRRIRSEMGCNINIAYGLTETSPNLTITHWDDDDVARSETVGKALPGAEVKIVDHNRCEVPTGEVGELACRSFGVMKGYYNMPEKTLEVLDENGWFYTGDLATIDEKGYIRIVGRKKEMIIRGGYNIYPREIEEVLYAHPAVMDVAIIGLPDSVLGEISCATVSLKPRASVEKEELWDYLKEKIADYKVPDKIVILDQFPMTASGKIRKLDLQKKIKEQLQAELR